MLRLLLLAALALTALAGCGTPDAPAAAAAAPDTSSAPSVHAASDLAAGRYLVVAGGCNDCHSVGYAETDGALPDSAWLTGSPVGFRGPWGTSYPKNLRLTADELTEDQWVQRMRAGGLPPMPWQATRALSDRDARAVYRFVRSLGAAGTPAPAAVGPGVEPSTPYFEFAPQHMERLGTPPEARGATPDTAAVS